jgi:hypothetical protein
LGRSSAQVPEEEGARHGEHAGTFDPPYLRAAAWMFAHLRPERAGDVVKVRAVEEGVRQSVHQSKGYLLVRAFQRLVQQDALPVRHRTVRPGHA